MMSLAEEGVRPGARILLIESDANVRRAARAVIDSLGHVVEVVADIEAAEDVLAHSEFDLALVDLNPRSGPGGFTLLRRIGAAGLRTRVIVLSANPDFEDVLAAFRLGAVDFLSKPLRTAELVAVVKRSLDTARHTVPEARAEGAA